MATVRVRASRVGGDRTPVARLVYSAQLFEDGAATGDAAWTCGHDHASPIEAQSCGLQRLSDLLAGTEGLEGLEGLEAPAGA